VKRRRVSASVRKARAMGRPRGRARLVHVQGETYEVLDLPGGGRKVFRLSLSYVEPRTPEWNLVDSQLRVDELRALDARGEIPPGTPRPVPPHTPGHRPGRAL
jgi:hypothetical protein